MATVGIKELKNNLSAYVRAAEAGETVLVTDRGKVVARLVPERPAVPKGLLSEAEILDQLEREGIVTRAKRRPGPPPRGVGTVPFDELIRQLDADREDR